MVSLTAADIASLEPAEGVIGASAPATTSAVAPAVQHASSPSKATVLFGGLPAAPTDATKVPSMNFSHLSIHVHTFITIKTFNVLGFKKSHKYLLNCFAGETRGTTLFARHIRCL